MDTRFRKVLSVVIVLIIASAVIIGVLYYSGMFDDNRSANKEGDDDTVRYILEHDTQLKNITWSGEGYTIQIGYDKKAVIEVIKDGKVNILDESRGIHTGYVVRTGEKEETFSSLNLAQDPVVHIDSEKNIITMNYSDTYTDNIVTINLDNKDFTVNYKRTITQDVGLLDQSLPSINLEQDVPESIRFIKSGSNLHVGGAAAAQKNYLAAGSGYRETRVNDIFTGNIRCAKREIDFTILAPETDGRDEVAVAFEGTLIGDCAEYDTATQIQRVPDGNALPLELDIIVANGRNLTCLGNADGWGKYDGRTVLQGEKVYRKINFTAGDVTEVSFKISFEDRDKYYDLGTLNGFDEAVLSEIINDFTRTMIMDWDMGTAVEGSQVFYELPALEQHWNTNLIGIFGDAGSLLSQKNGLLNITQIQANDGHIMSPYPQSGGDGWGSKYSDMMPGFVIAIVDMYILTGDRAFLDDLKVPAEKALAAQKKMYIRDDVYVCVNLTTTQTLNPNDYWEHNSGKYNGYTTPMYYQALVRWAEIERRVFGDEEKAVEYEALAVKIREDYNEMMWSEKTGTFLYGSESEDIIYLPVQAAVLSSGIAWEGRNERIIEAVERDTAVFDLGYHVMNIRDIQNADIPADQSDDHTKSMAGMNGGWYGAPDGEFFVAFPEYGDRTLIEKYINGLVKQYNITGFVNATCYKRDGVDEGDYGWWDMMQTMAYPIYGLYRYGYGFAPTLDGLNIEPFISENMIGSVVNYCWRGQNMTVTYNGLHDFTVNIAALPTDVTVRFINQVPGKTYQVSINGITQNLVADEYGVVSVKILAGKTNVKLINPEIENAIAVGSKISDGKPVAASSTYDINNDTYYWSSNLTDGEYTGYWRPDGEMDGQWLRVALGRSYDVGTFKLFSRNKSSFKYVIEGTNDPGFDTWTQIARSDKEVTVSGDSPLEVKISKKSEYSYIRIRFIETKNTSKLDVTEIEIYAK
ncbi:MAG: hypothetical protein E7385_03645 [Ruminococcaceae bacterium]|nr:hypothetical protein [Oscillospiraceae bacterium]